MADASSSTQVAPTVSLALSAVAVSRRLAVVSVLVCLAGLAVEIGHASADWPSDHGIVPYFSLSYEANVPTFWSAALLASCAVLLAIAASAAQGNRYRAHWWILSAGFAYMALDESIEIHEHMAFLPTSGVLYFSWIIPGAVVVTLVGLSYVGFLRHLQPRTRWLFVAAGAVYVLGALGCELPLGWWTSTHGKEDLGYALIDWVEETLEIAGASLFLWSLLRHLAGTGVTLRFASASAAKGNAP